MMKTEASIKFKKEEMMKTKPEQGRKGSFDIGNNIYLYSLVAVQMIYSLIVFIIKYVYIKIPTPVISAHKF